TIVLDTDTISRYHFSITKDGETIKIADMDSANGTFVDGVQLRENEERILQGGEEIQIGLLRMLFMTVDDQPTVPVTPLDDDTQRFIREEAGFMVDIHGPDIDIPPGSHSAIEINITNTSNESHLFTVQAEGLPKGWGRINRPSLRIDPNETAQVLYSIKPARQSDSKPGDYPITITVTNDETPEKSVEVGVTATILPYSGFGMALASSNVTLYEPVRLYVHNQGSADLPIVVSGTSQDDTLLFNINQPKMTLKPGERRTVQGEIKPRKRSFFGKPSEHSFDILVRSQDEANFLAAIRGKFIADPLLPTWAAYAIAGITLSIVGLLFAALIMILNPPTPQPHILSFSSAANPAPHNLPLTLMWDAEHAEHFSIRINGDVIEPNIPADQTSASVDVSAYTGQSITIQLVASSKGKSDTQDLTITVIQGLDVIAFDVTPRQIYRNFITTLNISWEVEGAQVTRLQGLENLLPFEPIEPNPGGEANFTVNGYATNSFTLTLIGEGEQGTTTSTDITINVVNAQCMTNASNYILYEQPDENSPIVITLEQVNQPIILEQRDPSGMWIQTRLPTTNTLAWGQVTGLTCPQDIRLSDLRIANDLPILTSLQPQIVSFQTDRQQIAAGESLNLTWEGRNAARYSLIVNNTVIRDDLAANTTSFQLDTAAFAGQTLQIELVAINGDLQDRKSLTVRITPTLRITQFEFSPMQLYRYVNQNITIQWQVIGAIRVDLQGVENLEPDITINSGQNQATIDVIGYAENNFSLTLVATGMNGETVEQTLNITVVDAQCTTNNANTSGRSAPNIAADIVETLAANVVLSVTGRDASGSWLQARLTSGELAWFVSDALTCNGFETNQLIIVPEGTP
ncbi:MAG: hypothetical protein CUN56_01040, partial [Phototrophicales bacterium]